MARTLEGERFEISEIEVEGGVALVTTANWIKEDDGSDEDTDLIEFGVLPFGVNPDVVGEINNTGAQLVIEVTGILEPSRSAAIAEGATFKSTIQDVTFDDGNPLRIWDVEINDNAVTIQIEDVDGNFDNSKQFFGLTCFDGDDVILQGLEPDTLEELCTAVASSDGAILVWGEAALVLPQGEDDNAVIVFSTFELAPTHEAAEGDAATTEVLDQDDASDHADLNI